MKWKKWRSNMAHKNEGALVTTEREGHVLLIGLNRPDKYNAFTVEMYQQLAAAYTELQNDNDLRVGVLFGHGKHFCAGLQLTDWAEHFASGTFTGVIDEGQIDPLGLHNEDRLTKPMLMAIHGICYTIGIEIMLATDIRIAAADTRFGQIEVKRGIYPVGGATVRWIQESGWSNAMRYLLTGDEFDGNEARRIGLVQEVCEAEQVLDEAKRMAHNIADQAPLGVYASLMSARIARTEGEQAAISRLMTDLKPIMQSDDAKEGVQSFVERRKAEFKGR